MKAPRSPCRDCAKRDRETCCRACEALAAYRADLDRLDPAEARKIEHFNPWCLGLAIASGASEGRISEVLDLPPEGYPYPEGGEA